MSRAHLSSVISAGLPLNGAASGQASESGGAWSGRDGLHAAVPGGPEGELAERRAEPGREPGEVRGRRGSESRAAAGELLHHGVTARAARAAGIRLPPGT